MRIAISCNAAASNFRAIEYGDCRLALSILQDEAKLENLTRFGHQNA
jgi:hypothetical protein